MNAGHKALWDLIRQVKHAEPMIQLSKQSKQLVVRRAEAANNLHFEYSLQFLEKPEVFMVLMERLDFVSRIVIEQNV